MSRQSVAEPDVIEREVAPTLPAAGGATVDVQVATARRFPRSITTFVRRATEMATLTDDVAASCIYALPRGGKTIEGPSARLAEICAHAWSNLRIQASTVDDGDGRFVTGRGEAWDVESNVAIGFEVKRRITDSRGQTYNEDMITVTGNAAASIALRNAVFKVIPASFWKPIYLECRRVIAGDVRTFDSRRDEMLKAFAVMGVTEERLCAAIGVAGRADITLDHLVPLRGIYNALKDGELTVETAFPDGGGLGAIRPAARKSDTNGQTTGQAAASKPAKTAAEPTTATTAADAKTTKVVDHPAKAQQASEGKAVTLPIAEAVKRDPIGTVDDIARNGPGAVVVLSSGFRAQTREAAIVEAAESAKAEGTRIELITRASSDPSRFAPTIEEILPWLDEEGGEG